MSRIHEIAQQSMARLAGSDVVEHVHNDPSSDWPNRAHRRAQIASLPRSLRRQLGFGAWRRHRYLDR